MLRQLVRTSSAALRRSKNLSSYSKQATRLFSTQVKLNNRSSRNKTVFASKPIITKLSTKFYSTNQSDANNDQLVNNTNDTSDLRIKILEGALRHVPKYGWSVEALTKATEEIGLPPIAHGVVDGPLDLVRYFIDKSNRQMIDDLEKMENFNQMNLKQKYKEILKLRLSYNIPYINRWSEALALLAHPTELPTSLKTLAQLADEIAYQTGDDSTNFDWYAKRAAITGLYTSTELYMLTDTSGDFKASWEFVERRIEDLVWLSKAKSNFGTLVSTAASGAFSIINGLLNSRGGYNSYNNNNNQYPGQQNPQNNNSQTNTNAVDQHKTSH
jgi:ubiquinone biosynthesis protein COQ9